MHYGIIIIWILIVSVTRMNNRFTEEKSLYEMIETVQLPLTVRISNNTKLSNELILQEGQHLTVLGIETLRFLKCSDQQDRLVFVNENTDTQVNIVEELLVQTEEHLIRQLHRITLILLKKKFGYESTICECGDTFFISEHFVCEKCVVLVRDKDNTKINLVFSIC